MTQTWTLNRRHFIGGCAAGAGLLALGALSLRGEETASPAPAAKAGRLDWLFARPGPALERRGLMLDISRCRVPTMETYGLLLGLLSELRYNELQLYTEHSFAYQGHEIVWKDASPMWPAEIHTLDTACRKAGIELVPNQNSLGHMERWLKHEPYKRLAESPNGAMAPWGFVPRASTMKPGPEAEALLKDLYAQLLPHFSSPRFNVGCDEPYDLGQGASKERCEKEGRGNVFFDHLDAVRRLAAAHGKRIEYWADVLFEEKSIPMERIPAEAVALVWGYEAAHPFAEQAAQVVARKVAWQACPGDSSWCSLGGRLHTARANIANATDVATRLKAEGLLHTHWGDNGHWQPFATLLPGLVLSATAAWNGEPCDWASLIRAMGVLCHDPEGQLAEALVALGRVDEIHGANPHNRSLFWEAHFAKPDAIAELTGRLRAVDPGRWELAENEFDRIELFLDSAKLVSDEARHYLAEGRLSLRMLRNSLQRIRALIAGTPCPDWARLCAETEAEHRRLWLLRHRPGGLEESCTRLRDTLA
jgi:hypothetical protein